MQPDIALAPHRRGVGIRTTVEKGLRTREDERHLDSARRESDDRHRHHGLPAAGGGDAGSSRHRLRPPTQHSRGDTIRFLLLMHEVYTAEEMVGHVEWLPARG